MSSLIKHSNVVITQSCSWYDYFEQCSIDVSLILIDRNSNSYPGRMSFDGWQDLSLLPIPYIEKVMRIQADRHQALKGNKMVPQIRLVLHLTNIVLYSVFGAKYCHTMLLYFLSWWVGFPSKKYEKMIDRIKFVNRQSSQIFHYINPIFKMLKHKIIMICIKCDILMIQVSKLILVNKSLNIWLTMCKFM